MRFLLMIVAILTASAAWSQKNKNTVSSSSLGPTSLEPSPHLKEVYGARIAKKKAKVRKPSVETRDEFEARMKRTAKAIRKREKLMKMSQYSDPRYFGHKRIPKKHKRDKMKFCKECEIRH